MYRLQPEQQKIVERAREIAEEGIRPHATRVDEESVFPRESIRALAQEGFLGLTVPAELGGMGQGLRTACPVLEEIAQRCASTAMIYLMHLCGLACYSARSGPMDPFLREAAQGRHLSTLALSERGSRSHFWAPVSRETRRNGHIGISAEKSWVTSAGEADGYVVSTGWAESENPLESILYLVLKEDPGISAAGAWSGLGMRGNASGPVKLDHVKVSSERALSEPGKGFDVMMATVLPVFQLGSAANSLGIAEAAVQATTNHLTTHRFEHLDSKLSDLPNQRARLARMRIATDCGRAHLVSTLDAVENPGPHTQLLVLESKAVAASASLEVTEIGMRACGGAAFSKHLGLERNFRDAQASVVMAPTTDHLHEFIGRALCGMELL